MSRLRDLWRTGQRGWPAQYPLAQFPNAPLLVGIAGAVTASATDGTAHDVARGVSMAGLVVWAVLELFRGDNAFRRALGGGFLALTAVRLVTGG